MSMNLPLTIDQSFPGLNAAQGPYVAGASAGIQGNPGANTVSPEAGYAAGLATNVNGQTPFYGPSSTYGPTAYQYNPNINQKTNTAPTNNPVSQPTGQTAQQQWQAAGHSGTAPVGYHGEAAAPPDPTQELINNNFNDVMNYLNGLQGSAQNNYGSIKSGINSGIDTSIQNLGASNQAAGQQIQQSADQGNQRKQDALIAAQRLYNELIQGGQQRFGGSSSAGEAYQALTSRELQRNNQSTQNDYSTFMGQIATAKNNLQVQYNNGLRSLEQQRNDALSQAERDYNNTLNQIAQNKVSAQSDKANAQLQALQQLRNNVYQINVANAQNSGALNTALQSAQQQLETTATQIHNTLGQVSQGQQAFNTNATTNPQTALSMAGTGGGNSQGFNPIGAISQNGQNRDLYGNLQYATA